MSLIRLAAHSARQNQTTTRALPAFLKSGWAALSGNRGQKGRLTRRASRAVVCVLHAVVVIPTASKPSGVTGSQLALGASDAPRDYNSSVFCTRQRRCGTAARERFAGRHKTVARLPTAAGLASK